MAVAAPAALQNDFGGHLANWLRQQGYAMPAAAPGFAFDHPKGATSTHDRGIRFSQAWKPQIEGLAGRYGTRGRMSGQEVSTLQTLLHEMLHQPLVNREPGWYNAANNNQRLWEEAAAEQAADDLLPAAAKQLFGYHYQPGARALATDPAVRDRSQRQRAYRAWSTLSSGSRNFQERGARVARRGFLNASTAERGQMLAAPPAARPKPILAPRKRVAGPDRPPGY